MALHNFKVSFWGCSCATAKKCVPAVPVEVNYFLAVTSKGHSCVWIWEVAVNTCLVASDSLRFQENCWLFPISYIPMVFQTYCRGCKIRLQPEHRNMSFLQLKTVVSRKKNYRFNLIISEFFTHNFISVWMSLAH